MKLRTIIVTVLILAALSVAVFVARRPAPPPSGDARLNQGLVDRATVEKATKVRLTDAGKTVTLARQSDGSTWRVTSYYDMPADFQKLSGFIGNLTDAKLQRLVTSNPDRIARLEFKDTKIELLDSADKEMWSITLGKNPEAGGGRFVRYGTEQKAYLASLSAWLDTESKNWANAELLNLKPDDLAKIEIPFPAVAATTGESPTPASAATTITISRAKKDDPWTADKTPAGQKVKADKVTSLIATIGTLRFSDTNEPTDPNVAAAKANLRTFKVTTFANQTITVAMGRKPEEKKLKPPAPTTDGKTGPAALGSLADLTKKETAAAEGEKKPEEKDAKPLAPEYETTPAGPVFVFVTHGDSNAPVNALMGKRAYQISDYTFTGLPQKADEFFEPAPPPAPPAAAPESPKPDATKPAEAKKP